MNRQEIASHPSEQTGRPSWRRAPKRRTWARIARAGAWVLGAGAIVAVLVVFVFPTRTYLDQRRQLASASQRLQTLNGQNAELDGRVAKLKSSAEIERIARERYHLVRPGEQAFAILPASRPTAMPPPPPVHKGHRSGIWERMTSWL
ncbi:MAG: hypothetical protein NVS3B12_17020 [Acidimicrobiales bacterium]